MNSIPSQKKNIMFMNLLARLLSCCQPQDELDICCATVHISNEALSFQTEPEGWSVLKGKTGFTQSNG